MRKIDKKILALSTILLSSMGAVYAQTGTGAGSYTSVNGTASVSEGLTISIMSEKLVFSMDAIRKIDGDYRFYGKEVQISSSAKLEGEGTIYLHDPSSNPSYSQMTSSTTKIDGNNGNYITTAKISVLNPKGITLENLTMPANNGSITYDEGPSTGAKKAALNIAGNLSLDVDGANVFLATNDLQLDTNGIISNYGINRMVVTGNAISGHLVKDQKLNNTFVYPVGISERDYTPATIDANSGVYNVSVVNYAVTTPSTNPGLLGMGRTWHIFSDLSDVNSFSLKHNDTTDNSKYVDNAAFITQLGQSTNTWSVGSSSDYVSSGFHTNDVLAIPNSSVTNAAYFSKSVVYVPVSGNIWNDANGDKTKNSGENFVSGSATTFGGSIPVPNDLFVNLVASDGKILASVPVNNDGSYIIPEVIGNSVDLKIVLTSTQGVVGSNIVSTLPSGWTATGTNIGTNTASQLGALNNEIKISTSDVAIENQLFGLNRIPTAEVVTTNITSPSVNQSFNFSGGSNNLPMLTGADPEDQPTTSSLASKSVMINTLPTKGELWYDGVLITTGSYMIPNFDPAKLTLVFTGPLDYTSTYFTYSYVDNAGTASTPARFTVNISDPLDFDLLNLTVSSSLCNEVEVKWQTGKEIDLSHFEIEYSDENLVFQSIGRVAAENILIGENYSFFTKQAANLGLYRLKIVEIDGTITYSKTIKHLQNCVKDGIRLYPNPANNFVVIDNLASAQYIRVYSNIGELVYESKISELNHKIDLSNFNAGLYLLSVTNKDHSVMNYKLLKK